MSDAFKTIADGLKGQLYDLKSFEESVSELAEEETREYAPSDQDIIKGLIRQRRLIEKIISSLARFVEKDVVIMRDIDRATYGLLNVR